MTILINPRRQIFVAIGALLAFACIGAFAPTARAGVYYAWECGMSAGGLPWNDVGNNNAGNATGTAGYTSRNDCANQWPPTGFGYAFGHQAFSGAPTGTYRAWDIFAPPGTRFLSGTLEGNLYGIAGHEPLISVGNGSALQTIAGNNAANGGGWRNYTWNAPFENTTQLVVWLACASGSGYCEDVAGYSTAYARNMIFAVQDYTPPASSVGGTLAGGGWRSSGGSLAAIGTDYGGGVHHVDHYLNGTHVRRDAPDCSVTTLWGGTVGSVLTPCRTSHSDSLSLGTGSFQQGANLYQGCTYDFATDGNPNGVCASETVYIDTVAPTLGGGVNLAGGNDWRPSNEFDVDWSNPQQAHAPIDGAFYRLTKVGGGYDSGAQFVSGANRSSLSDLSVPSPGEYTLKVWTRDQAGNQSESNSQTTTLRYDPTVPPASEAEYNGWIRRNDFSYTARWNPVSAGSLGPSGLDGYAVTVTQDPSSDPCITDANPSPSCSDAEVNNQGIGDIEMPLTVKQDGDWYIHVAPVTGAGVKAEVKHTEMPVDDTDPVSSIDGASGEWTNKDVTVSVSAIDSLSGMVPNASKFPQDPQPRTCVQVGSGTADCEPDADVSRVISAEGDHDVAYFARDLAGNENTGQPDANYAEKMNNPPNHASVRIDKTAPHGAFITRDVNDPAKVIVQTSDALSGVVGGTIEIRKASANGSWSGLATVLEGASLVARVPDDVEPGRYEFRAQITDRAGNSAITGQRADGSAMVEELPLKEASHLSAAVNGAKDDVDDGKKKCKDKKRPKKCKCKGKRGKKCKGGKSARAASDAVKVPYGREMTLSGVLRTSDDKPLAGRELVVTETMVSGGTPQSRTSRTSTNGYGEYEVELEAGASRRVSVEFAGDSRHQRVSADPVDVAVKAKVLKFRSPRTVPETNAIKFRGRLGMLGADLGTRGKRIELEYRKGRNWKTIDSGQTRPDGSFKLSYGLRSNYLRRTKVIFRLAVPGEGGWPYAGVATSRARKTTILP